jgi:photosynthetic reaction center cytochrome c subunit
MKLGSRRTIIVATGTAGARLVGVALAIGQAGPGPRPQMAEEVFKNVQVLKGIPVDEFMGTMGVFSAALGLSCEDCHEANDSNWANYALDTGPKKRTARRMVLMMSAINRNSFGGRQVVTCYTCHRGSTSPRVTPSLAALYGAAPPDETSDDIVAQAPGAPAADQILDKYIQALGGPERVANLTSLVVKGTSVGYGPEGQKRPVEVFGKAPDLRTTIIHTLDGDSTTTYDGRAGWIAAPHRPVAVLALTGDDLDGVKLEAELLFPARIKQALGKWRVGFPAEIDDRPVQVVQGTSAGGALATLYFDGQSGLLIRLVHYAQSPVGRMPTQIDYADYRDVAGVKMPYRWKVTWLDGVETVEVTDVQPNVPIDAAKFAKPAPSTK